MSCARPSVGQPPADANAGRASCKACIAQRSRPGFPPISSGSPGGKRLWSRFSDASARCRHPVPPEIAGHMPTDPIEANQKEQPESQPRPKNVGNPKHTKDQHKTVRTLHTTPKSRWAMLASEVRAPFLRTDAQPRISGDSDRIRFPLHSPRFPGKRRIQAARLRCCKGHSAVGATYFELWHRPVLLSNSGKRGLTNIPLIVFPGSERHRLPRRKPLIVISFSL